MELDNTQLPNGTEEFAPAKADKEYSNFQKAWYRFTRNPTAVIGLLIVLSVVIVAVFAPWIAPHPEHAGTFVNFRERHHAPSWEYWLGTDNVGRDILSRVWCACALCADWCIARYCCRLRWWLGRAGDHAF